MTNGEVKGEAKIQTRIGQKMINQEDLIQKVKEVMLLEIIGENRDISDTAKRITLKKTVWQKIFICIMRRKQIKMST